MKKLLIGAAGAAVLFVGATGFAAAAPPETTDGLVCPVLGGEAGVNANGNTPFVSPDGTYSTVIGPDVTVPVFATNADGDATPVDGYASPGDPDYTAIWG